MRILGILQEYLEYFRFFLYQKKKNNWALKRMRLPWMPKEMKVLRKVKYLKNIYIKKKKKKNQGKNEP